MAHSGTVLTVSVLSLKGGVGKTTVTLGLAASALARGLRVVVIDLDPQGNATVALDPPAITLTASDVLLDGKVRADDALAASGWDPSVRVMASDPLLEQRNHPKEGAAAQHALRSVLAKLKKTDLVVIDCPPSLANLTTSALTASDLALVVTEPSIFAAAGVQQAVTAIEAVRKRYNLRLRTAGIVVNRVRSRSAEHRFRIDELSAAYRHLVLDPVLPERSAISAAQGSAVPITRWPSPGAREVARTFDRYLETIVALGASSDSKLLRTGVTAGKGYLR